MLSGAGCDRALTENGIELNRMVLKKSTAGQDLLDCSTSTVGRRLPCVSLGQALPAQRASRVAREDHTADDDDRREQIEQTVRIINQ